MKYLFATLGIIIFATFSCLANDTQSIGIQASVGTINPTFNIAVTPVDAATDSWGTTDETPPYNMNFGTLTADTANNILVADTYFAVGVGIVSNVPWTLRHTATSIAGSGGDLDDNVNVSFVSTNGSSDTSLAKLSYANTKGGVNYTDADFGSGRWLRIYYGIATGDSGDAPGAEPIPIDQPTGAYSGTVNLSVTAR
jgi:hypothetical protein